jgi:hypothetical protein
MFCRATKEEKDRRKRWAKRKTSSKPDKKKPLRVEDTDAKAEEEVEDEETHAMPGTLPKNVIEMLAAREKYVYFLSVLDIQILALLFSVWTLLVTLSSFFFQANLPIRLRGRKCKPEGSEKEEKIENFWVCSMILSSCVVFF